MAIEKKVLGIDGAQQMAAEIVNLMSGHNVNKQAHADIRDELTEITRRAAPFIIEVTQNADGTYGADVTYADAINAFAESRRLLCQMDSTYIPLGFLTNEQGICFLNEFNGASTAILIAADDSVEVISIEGGYIRSINGYTPDDSGNVTIPSATVEDVLAALPTWEGGSY